MVIFKHNVTIGCGFKNFLQYTDMESVSSQVTPRVMLGLVKTINNHLFKGGNLIFTSFLERCLGEHSI